MVTRKGNWSGQLVHGNVSDILRDEHEPVTYDLEAFVVENGMFNASSGHYSEELASYFEHIRFLTV